MSAYDSRHPASTRPLGGRGRIAMFAYVASVTMAAIISLSHGAIATGEDISVIEREATPISLAGRWTGPRHGFGARTKSEGCQNGRCTLTLDISACGADWCGIIVTPDGGCGAQALKVTQSASPDRRSAFEGKLELAKGSDPYVVEAWYSPAAAGEPDPAPRLGFIGDTGPELMMFRRSFPFSANLAREGEAKCALERATS